LIQENLIKEKNSLPKAVNMIHKGVFAIFACEFLIFLASQPGWAQDQTEGKKLYTTYCSSCHGDNGKGDGPAAKALPIKPADHTDGSVMNPLSDKFLTDVISKGGSAVGKSPMMPAWGGQLNEKQVRNIVAYLRSIAEPPYKTPGK
jgi:mono/diheme cytochrome c family protein